ncbi:hypothetical protein N7466_004320 [Penicillium verhagenii]|uniref:uncharacterized protein n=1 Tax=Penicillium verhagenii TaxID=1562060 RepID=UPI00254524C7|nr:uncharacterized protein N7466_004320 [Penicillium verhagenii]KAJ5934773.1 hypothetical protein N7466_004320 [Penicillium verhagenii]
MTDIAWKDMAPTVAAVGVIVFALRQYSKYNKAQRVVFQFTIVFFILGLSLFVASQLLSLVNAYL